MNVTESTAVNALLSWLCVLRHVDGRKVTDEEAKAAAQLLADASWKRLHAGVTPGDVKKRFRVQAEIWPALTEPPTTQLDLLGSHKRPRNGGGARRRA